jgi:hypothetical protein
MRSLSPCYWAVAALFNRGAMATPSKMGYFAMTRRDLVRLASFLRSTVADEVAQWLAVVETDQVFEDNLDDAGCSLFGRTGDVR